MGFQHNDIHIEAIKRALRNKNAAVMVGAGFSRNSENGHLLKTWPELAEEISKRLEPSNESYSHSPSQVTQLGEQFARVFSVPELEDLLKRNIPDESVSPGELHDQLLRLPWSEVFTTNYDTLLERAADKIFERSHFTVCSREDIPLSKVLGRRRIVKLHGSFPSQRPFIFTEEDYRTYPEKFSPFINLVRQSLVENVFCLIGFSGDDPNFLNWIGWVRDVLEKNANSVYLFLSKEPSYGNRKLLEARGVTPVVIPNSSANRENNYYNRFLKLFEMLKEPVDSNPLEWGEISWSHEDRKYEESHEERAKKIFSLLENLSKVKRTYPEWIVAPTSVRRRLRVNLNGIPEKFSDSEVLSLLKEQSPEVAVAAFYLYAWVQSVLLEPMEDVVALGALEALSTAKEKRKNGSLLVDNETLEKLGVNKEFSFNECWEGLAKELLHWSRQSLKSHEIDRILNLVEEAGFPSSELSDCIIHERILRHLYQGELDKASLMVREWEPKSSDPFFLVLKSSVLAEVGDPKQAIVLCNTAIQKIRKMQRSNPEDNVLLSKEAWACFVCHDIQRSLKFLSDFRGGDSGVDADSLVEDLDKRLTALSQSGYDCPLIITEVLSDLDSEASSAIGDRVVSHGFDIGSVSTTRMIGLPAEQVRKLRAAFQWLELTERVGLIPRVGNTVFYIDSYLQAAWWTQYSDTVERMLSILIRTRNANAIKPKNYRVPKYKTGWLSRFQVARIPENVCEEICDRLLSQVELMVDKKDVEKFLDLGGFYLEIYSRLVIRVSKLERVHDFVTKLVSIHCSPMATNHMARDFWKALAAALSRSMESLPDSEQTKAVREIVKIPLLPNVSIQNPFIESWTDLVEISFSGKADGDVEVDAQISASLEHVMDVIAGPKSDDQESSLLVVRAWHRLYWLMNLGLVSAEHKEKAATILWGDRATWPTAPGFYSHATFNWIPPYIKEPDVLFKEWCLMLDMSSFHSPANMQVNLKGRDYSWHFPVNNQALVSWVESLKRCSWTQEDADLVISKMWKWWEAEGGKVDSDLFDCEQLGDEVRGRLNLFDLVLFLLATHDGVDRKSVFEEAKLLINALPDQVAHFWRIKVLMKSESNFIGRMEDDFLSSLMSGNSVKEDVAISSMADALPYLDRDEFDMYANAASSLLVSQDFSNIIVGLKLLIQFMGKGYFEVSGYQLFMIREGLAKLGESLSYQGVEKSVGIPESAIPLLRYYCFSVAYLVSERVDDSCPESPEIVWICEASNDPLPEIKYGRYIKKAVKN